MMMTLMILKAGWCGVCRQTDGRTDGQTNRGCRAIVVNRDHVVDLVVIMACFLSVCHIKVREVATRHFVTRRSDTKIMRKMSSTSWFTENLSPSHMLFYSLND